jgi:hypothetical protein
MMSGLSIAIGLFITGAIAWVASLIRKSVYQEQELAAARLIEAERKINDEVKTKSDDDLDAAIKLELAGTGRRDDKG